MNQNTDWLSHADMENLHPVKRQIIEEVISEIEGKSLTKAAPVIVQANKKLKQHGMAFTNEENELLFSIMTEQMSPEQKENFKKMRQMIQTNMQNMKK